MNPFLVLAQPGFWEGVVEIAAGRREGYWHPPTIGRGGGRGFRSRGGNQESTLTRLGCLRGIVPEYVGGLNIATLKLSCRPGDSDDRESHLESPGVHHGLDIHVHVKGPVSMGLQIFI